MIGYKIMLVMVLVLLSKVHLNQEISSNDDNKELIFLENERINSVNASTPNVSSSGWIWPWPFNPYSKSKLAKEKKIPSVDPNMIVPGFTGRKGYVSYLGKFVRNECFKPSKTVTGRTIMTANSLSRSTSKSLMKELSVGMSLSAGVADMVRVGLNFDSDKAFEESQYSLDFYYYMKFTRDREIQYGILPEEVLEPEALKLYQTSKSEFMKKCGNQVVSKVREGAIILIHAKFEFASKAEKAGFSVGMNLKLIDLVKLSADFSNHLRTSNRKGNIKFSGYQFGGDIHKFSAFFPDNTSDACGAVVDTTLDFAKRNTAFKECEKFLSDIYDYMNNDFPLQMKDEDESSDEELDTLIKYYPFESKVSKIPALDFTGVKYE